MRMSASMPPPTHNTYVSYTHPPPQSQNANTTKHTRNSTGPAADHSIIGRGLLSYSQLTAVRSSLVRYAFYLRSVHTYVCAYNICIYNTYMCIYIWNERPLNHPPHPPTTSTHRRAGGRPLEHHDGHTPATRYYTSLGSSASALARDRAKERINLALSKRRADRLKGGLEGASGAVLPAFIPLVDEAPPPSAPVEEGDEGGLWDGRGDARVSEVGLRQRGAMRRAKVCIA